MKNKRQQVWDKYNGKCAYTGKPLGDDWQVDHMTPKVMDDNIFKFDATGEVVRLERKYINNIENLMPACYIVNHYKRALDLEGFRRYMLTFHTRLAKLPKKTLVPRTERRKRYMLQIAELFDITPDQPFCGKFYFERLVEQPE